MEGTPVAAATAWMLYNGTFEQALGLKLAPLGSIDIIVQKLDMNCTPIKSLHFG
jgi:hypothetical protein